MVDYCTRADVFTFGRFSATEQADTAIQAEISALITTVSAQFDQLAERSIVADGNTTRYFHLQEWQDRRLLRLDDFIVSVTSVINGNEISINANDYQLLPLNSVRKSAIRLKASYSWVHDVDVPIAVTGEWAFYPSGNVPNVLAQACVKAVWQEWKRDKVHHGIDKPMMTDSGHVLVPARWSRDVLDVIAYYRKVL